MKKNTNKQWMILSLIAAMLLPSVSNGYKQVQALLMTDVVSEQKDTEAIEDAVATDVTKSQLVMGGSFQYSGLTYTYYGMQNGRPSYRIGDGYTGIDEIYLWRSGTNSQWRAHNILAGTVFYEYAENDTHHYSTNTSYLPPLDWIQVSDPNLVNTGTMKSYFVSGSLSQKEQEIYNQTLQSIKEGLTGSTIEITGFPSGVYVGVTNGRPYFDIGDGTYSLSWDGTYWAVRYPNGEAESYTPSYSFLPPVSAKWVDYAGGFSERTSLWTAGVPEEIVIGENGIVFSGTNKVPVAGKMIFDADKDHHVLFNSRTNTALDVGYEERIQVRNNTGGLITEGTPVYINTDLFAGNAKYIEPAKASDFNKSRVLAIATEDMYPNETGEATVRGDINDFFHFYPLTNGPVWLGSNGGMTQTRPVGANYLIPLGTIIGASEFFATMYVDINTTETTVEMDDTNGFPTDQRAGTTITFTNATRTLQISSTTNTHFHYYQDGLQYTKSAPVSVQIGTQEGVHIVFFDGTTLTNIANPTQAQIADTIRTKCFVSYVYWDVANSRAIYIGDERHGISMSPYTHAYVHFTRGAQWLFGGGLADIVIGDGSLPQHAKFSVESGLFADDDINHAPVAIGTNDSLYVNYLVGSTPSLRTDIGTNAGSRVLNAPAGRLYYNQFTGGSWVLTEVGNNNFVHYHTFWINGVAGLSPQTFQVMGQATYTTVADARTGLANEVAGILLNLPGSEAVLLGSVLYQTGNAYANPWKARVVANIDGDSYTSWTGTELSAGTPPSSHVNLTDRDAANSHPISAITDLAPLVLQRQSKVVLGKSDADSGSTWGPITSVALPSPPYNTFTRPIGLRFFGHQNWSSWTIPQNTTNLALRMVYGVTDPAVTNYGFAYQARYESLMENGTNFITSVTTGILMTAESTNRIFVLNIPTPSFVTTNTINQFNFIVTTNGTSISLTTNSLYMLNITADVVNF